jgi:TatD DNase family protein
VIDTHAHLDFKQFDQDRSKVITYAFSNGVEKIINIGVDLKSSESSIKLTEEHEQIYATVGFHPHDAKNLTEESLKQITKLAQHKKVVAIGEIGLDFYRNLSPKEDQIRAFRKQIALATELELPMVVHVREAWEPALAILRETGAGVAGGVLHSFSGNSEQAKTAQDMGFYLGLNGTLTYPKSRIQSVAREISLDSIVVETDCPFLSPAPHRGKRNQPAYVKFVLERLSDLFRLDHASVGRIAYPIRDSLYLNITNRCSNACLFCVRNRTDFVKGHNLRLDHEPTYQEVVDSINHPEKYREVVFCGYGEPTIRLDLLKEVARYLKNKNVEVRLNTNGQGNLIHKRNIVPELVGLIEMVSISLNVDDEEKYERLCQPRFGDNAFGQVVAFARECKKLLPRTVLTVLDMPEVDLKKCETISRELGMELRIRHYNRVG